MSDWGKDWDNPDDAVYDGPDEEQLAAAAKRKAMREYMEWSAQLEDELIAEMGQEAYDASQHWINNPLIKPVSKVAMFEEWEARIRREQDDRTIKLFEALDTCDCDPDDGQAKHYRCGATRGLTPQQIMTLIRGGKPESLQAHHCGFDFLADQTTARCSCGVVSTNPFLTFKGEK
jgi:hypothetical protein